MSAPASAGARTLTEEQDDLEYEYAVQMQRILGEAVMDLFDAQSTSELYVNPGGQVWAVTNGRGHTMADLRLTEAQVEAFLNVAASRLGETVTPRNPRLQGELPRPVFGGARLQGVTKPVTAGAMFKVRKRPQVVVPLEDYLANGILSPAQYDAIRWAISQDFGIAVAGPTSSGKTYLLNALLHEQTRLTDSPNAPVLVLEDTVEVISGAPNTVSMRTTPECDFDALLYIALRFTPKYLHVGECRRYAYQMLEMWSTGHPGFCTVHASDGEGALERFGRLARRDTGRSEGWLVAHSVRVVIVIRPTPEGRRVTEVVQCTGYRRGRYQLARL